MRNERKPLKTTIKSHKKFSSTVWEHRRGQEKISYRGVAQLVARLLWEQEAGVRAAVLGKPGTPWDTWADSTFPLAGNWSKTGVDHILDHS